MGWLFSPAPRAKDHHVEFEIKNIFQSSEPSKIKYEIVQKSRKGNVWYVACQTTNLETKESQVWGCVILTKSYTEHGQRWWGYKAMDETMLPYYFEAPKSLIQKLSPTTDENALKWREICLEKKSKMTRFRTARPLEFTFPDGRKAAQEFEHVKLHRRRGVYKCLDLPGTPLVRLTKGDMVDAVAL